MRLIDANKAKSVVALHLGYIDADTINMIKTSIDAHCPTVNAIPIPDGASRREVREMLKQILRDMEDERLDAMPYTNIREEYEQAIEDYWNAPYRREVE